MLHVHGVPDLNVKTSLMRRKSINQKKKKKKKTKERREFHSEICSFLLHFRENREKKERKKIFRK